MSYRGSATDQDALNVFLFRLYSNLQGAVTAALVHLGDRLGLFRALADADEPLSSADLAGRTGLDERWVREWAYQQGAAELIVVDPETERISLTPEGVAVLADESHEAFGLGEFDHLPGYFSGFDDVDESFRTGVGHNYDHAGVESTIGLERAFEPWNRHHLVPDVLPALDGVTDRLADGILAADVGCGAGGAVLLMAAAFPATRFTGYDISQLALARAERAAGRGRSRQRRVRRPALAAAARRRLARIRHDVRLPPRHVAPPGDGERGAHEPRRRRHVAAVRHQGARHVRARTSRRTRWRR